MQDIQGLWQSVLGDLEVSITQASFKTWFKQTDILSKEDGHVIVAVPNVITKQWLENKFHTEIKTALARADQSIATVEYKVSGLVAGGSPKPAPARAVTMHAAAKRSDTHSVAKQTTLPTAPHPAQTSTHVIHLRRSWWAPATTSRMLLARP
jgi:chromosomal replication initiation ATPase DnaA